MYYAYILESLSRPGERYTGSTSDLKSRLREHNAGLSAHTAKFHPWRIVFYAAFENEPKARAFERYLKTGSGREFSRRHF
ncbi:MAG: GIY-YIG nuclease family protein [Candidatus Didemnitutus sp.]|nr:GIY-YIG nuclease family protein [Candidatus Didemnitutus sp.]